MKLIISYMKEHRYLVAAAMVIKMAGTLGELLIPYILEHLIDHVVPMKDSGLVFFWGGIMIAAAFLVRQLNVTANRMSVRTAQLSTQRMRQDLFEKAMELSGGQFDSIGLPSLTSRMTSDSYNVQSFIQSIQAVGIRSPILMLGGIAITMTMDRGLSLILCVMVPILLVVIVTVSRKGIPLYNRVQECIDDIVRTMRENITGIRVVKALSKEDYEIRRFGRVNETLTQNDMKAGTVMALPGPIMTLFLNMGLTLVVLIGAVRVNKGLTQPGVILAFLTYFNMILMGVMGLNRIFMLLSKAAASAGRIGKVTGMPRELTPIPEEQASHTDSSDFIVFDHVDFHYAGAQEKKDLSDREAFAGEERQNCLTDIHFSMKRGASLGIIGATGCGKTTIINLLMRFYDADKGGVFIDGRDVRTYDKDELHRMFGVVFQNDVILADTLASNICFGRPVTREAMEAAAADARVQEYIEEQEDRYEHRAVIKGANLSGGQKQRILIARALAARPQILILDDASSALDYKTDAALRQAIRKHYGDTTTIIVAQRISSIMYLDDILVLDEGRIIGHGTHEELMASCDVYQDIYQSQMGSLE